MNKASPLGYTGVYQDPVCAGYPLGHGYRSFLPWLMRFNAPDDWSPFQQGGINPYAYCGGDPINRSDPSGHMWAEELETLPELEKLYEKMGRLDEKLGNSPAPAVFPCCGTIALLTSGEPSPNHLFGGSIPRFTALMRKFDLAHQRKGAVRHHAAWDIHNQHQGRMCRADSDGMSADLSI
jgi:RHS repeat-associated protein